MPNAKLANGYDGFDDETSSQVIRYLKNMNIILDYDHL